MKSANSYSNPSMAWYKENLRRFWVLPLIEFLALFLINILPIIICYSKLENTGNYISITLTGYNFGDIIVFSAFAIVVSAAVYSYIHDTASATIVHSMPITRRKLFRSSFFSGLIMLIIPIIVIGILFIAISGAHVSPDAVKSNFGSRDYHVITFVHICIWILESSIIVTFVYAMANLAGIIAGNRVIHVLLALFINGLPYALLELVKIYENNFFYGYPDYNLWNFMKISPVGYAMTSEKFPNFGFIVPAMCYVIAAIAVTFFSSWLYTKIKLERERSACVFPVIADIVCVLLTFICMSLLGILITTSIIDESNNLIPIVPFLLISFAASVIIYIICRMIADGTTKVFNKSNLKKFGIYIVAVAVFFAFTVFDITGYQNRIPGISDVKSISFNTSYNIRGAVNLTSIKSIKNVTAFQRAILSDYKGANKKYKSNYENCDYIEISYTLKNGRKVKRNYEVPSYTTKPYRNTDSKFKVIFYSAEFKDKNCYNLSADALNNIKSINLNYPKSDTDDRDVAIVNIASKDYKELLSAVNNDIRVSTLESAGSQGDDHPIICVRTYGSKSKHEDNFYDYAVTKHDTDSLEFLKSKGYWAELQKKK